MSIAAQLDLRSNARCTRSLRTSGRSNSYRRTDTVENAIWQYPAQRRRTVGRAVRRLGPSLKLQRELPLSQWVRQARGNLRRFLLRDCMSTFGSTPYMIARSDTRPRPCLSSGRQPVPYSASNGSSGLASTSPLRA